MVGARAALVRRFAMRVALAVVVLGLQPAAHLDNRSTGCLHA